MNTKLAGDKLLLQVEHYVEKPETFVSNTINCGVYVLGIAVLDHMKVIQWYI